MVMWPLRLSWPVPNMALIMGFHWVRATLWETSRVSLSHVNCTEVWYWCLLTSLFILDKWQWDPPEVVPCSQGQETWWRVEPGRTGAWQPGQLLQHTHYIVLHTLFYTPHTHCITHSLPCTTHLVLHTTHSLYNTLTTLYYTPCSTHHTLIV